MSLFISYSVQNYVTLILEQNKTHHLSLFINDIIMNGGFLIGFPLMNPGVTWSDLCLASIQLISAGGQAGHTIGNLYNYTSGEWKDKLTV